jgi:lipopolysaccharide/colanic/teichoic acid biosynthesis glycosyltransferase
MYKLRTMHLHVEQGSGPAFTEENDPRVFPLGRFLRRTHIDEIPQLLNVLRGEMSLIGPRPERPEFLPHLRAQFPGFDKRLELRAGITGLAQTTSGYADNFRRYRRKLHLDRIYIERCCLGLDLFIALKTIGVLFTGAGAR